MEAQFAVCLEEEVIMQSFTAAQLQAAEISRRKILC